MVSCVALFLLSLDIFFFFFNDTATTEIYTLSLHDALPISFTNQGERKTLTPRFGGSAEARSEEHTSELQSQSNLVCRLLLEKKKKMVSVLVSRKKKKMKKKRQKKNKLE